MALGRVPVIAGPSGRKPGFDKGAVAVLNIPYLPQSGLVASLIKYRRQPGGAGGEGEGAAWSMRINSIIT